MKSLVFSSLTAVRQGRKGYGIRYQPSTAKVRYARSASCLRHIAYSDFWEADHRVLPSKRHRAVGKESGQTNHIERFNCTLGQRISPLVRKTLSFSKKLENHIGAIGVLCSPLQCILTCVGLPTPIAVHADGTVARCPVNRLTLAQYTKLGALKEH